MPLTKPRSTPALSPKWVSVLVVGLAAIGSGCGGRVRSSRGATQGLIEKTGLGIVTAIPMPAGTCQTLSVTVPSTLSDDTSLSPPPPGPVAESGMSGPQNSLRLAVGPAEVNRLGSPLGSQVDK